MSASKTLADGELLTGHLAGREEAFEELVRRHAAMVLGACRRMLGDGQDAEDAAQAVFLLLARKARGLTSAEDLGAWLHRSARLVSRTALRARARRERHEREAAAMRGKGGQADGSERFWREHAGKLDDALDSLPAVYRQALVLCYLEGLSQAEAAERLSVPESTLSSRCTRGLERLRAGLGGAGRRIGAAALGALLLERAAGAAPEGFLSSVVAAAKGAAAGAPVLALTEGALQAMFWTKIKFAGVLAAAAAVLAAVTPPAVRVLSRASAGEAATAAADEPAAVAGLKLTLAAEKADAKAGDEVRLTITFENVSKEKMRIFWPVARFVSDQVSLQATGPGVVQGAQVRPMIAMIPTAANFPELEPGGKKTLEVKLSGNPPAFSAWALYLTKEGAYKVKAVYTYRGGGPELPELAPAGAPGAAPEIKPWNGTVSSGEVELKLSGEFQPAPQRGLIRPGGRAPGGQLRPVTGRGMKVPEELYPDREPQPLPARPEEM